MLYYKNIFTLVIFLLIVNSAFAQQKSTSAVTPLKAPVATKLQGYESAYCVGSAKTLRICKARVLEAQSHNGKFLLELNGKKISEWETDLTVQTMEENFSVLQGDLDADGTIETIVVNLTGESNGLGVRYFDVKIFPAFTATANKNPLSFSVEEFGKGTFITQPGVPGTLIFVTNWITSSDLDKKSGTYLMGKWFRYNKGFLEAVNKPTMVRRLLNNFSDERVRLTGATPYSWFANGKGRAVTSDPEIYGKPTIIANATIIAVKEEKVKEDEADEDSSVQTHSVFVLKTESGEEISYVKGYAEEVKSKIPNVKYFAKFGLQQQQFILPSGIGPETILANLVGQKIQIVSYKFNPEFEPDIVLWLQR